MMAEKQRVRQPNYNNEEKVTLLNIVERYKNIILNKKTDHTTWKDKEIAWQNVANNFNAISPAGVHRTAEHLKGYFNNLKKKTKKDAADQKLSIRKTGSGPPETEISDPTFNLTLSLLNEKTVFGLQNKYDSDDVVEHVVLQDIEDCEVVPTMENIDVVPEMEPGPSSENIISTTPAITDWAKHTPTHLQSIKNKKLCTGKTNKEWTKRRRPVHMTEKSELTDLYREIAKEKLAFYKTQNEEIAIKRKRDTEEYERRMKWEDEHNELKKHILLLDIELRKKQLVSYE